VADFSIILVSHNKPHRVEEAVRSVLAQTHASWEAILVDSGVLLDQGFFDFIGDNRFRVIPSGETPEMGKGINMASWCFNQVLGRGLARGELIMYLCDDDLLYPEAFETFWRYYVGRNREPQAMYASQDIGLVTPEGVTQIVGRRKADRPAGRFCRGRKLDCQVDYLQFCHTAAILERFREVYRTDRYHCEDKGEADHADGIFMEQIGAITTVHPIDQVLSMNRRTPESANLLYASTRLGRILLLIRAKGKGAWRRIKSAR
jgi:glycosyltransferase involved in cell wall biosynthesis